MIEMLNIAGINFMKKKIQTTANRKFIEYKANPRRANNL